MELIKNGWLMIYPLLCVFLPCVAYQVIQSKRSSGRCTKKNNIWIWVFVLYLFMMLSVAGVGTVWDIGRDDSIIRVNEINLIPFHSYGMRTYILNIIMFTPLGFLLPLIWRDLKGYIVMLEGLGMSFMIEVMQLFNHRQSDVDDLMMNCLGTLVGLLIWKTFSMIFRIKSSSREKTEQSEAIIYMILSVLGTFFFYNEIFFEELFYC